VGLNQSSDVTLTKRQIAQASAGLDRSLRALDQWPRVQRDQSEGKLEVFDQNDPTVRQFALGSARCLFAAGCNSPRAPVLVFGIPTERSFHSWWCRHDRPSRDLSIARLARILSPRPSRRCCDPAQYGASRTKRSKQQAEGWERKGTIAVTKNCPLGTDEAAS